MRMGGNRVFVDRSMFSQIQTHILDVFLRTLKRNWGEAGAIGSKRTKHSAGLETASAEATNPDCALNDRSSPRAHPSAPGH